MVESSDVLFCSTRREATCCAACWPRGVVTDVGTECTIWIPPMGIIGNGERTWNENVSLSHMLKGVCSCNKFQEKTKTNNEFIY